MSWEHRAHRVMDHVRAHLDHELSIGVLADVAGASRYHFARMFRAVTGETVVHFVQRARLERAATLMKTAPARPLHDVALECGFASASDFSRVFRQHHGTAPSQWDRRSRLGRDRIAGYADALAEARRTCRRFAPRTASYPACRLATVRLATPFADNALLQAGWERLAAWAEAQGLDWQEMSLLGMSWDHYETTPLDQVRFDLGLIVPPGVDVTGEVREQHLPAMDAAALRVQGGKPCIAVAWERLYDEVLPRSTREPADLPGIKRFRRRPHEGGWRTFDLDCTIPLT